jgi:hypothetical protein
MQFYGLNVVGSYGSKPHDPLVQMHEHINSILKLTYQINVL